MRKFNKKTMAIVAAVIAVAGVSAGAYAYWTAGGSGTGTAATGTNVAITAVQTSTITAMRPGDTAQTLAGNFTNNAANAGPVFVTSVTASIASVTKNVGAVAGTCDATDYTLSNPVMSVGAQVPAGVAQGAWTGATIQFNNKVTNQDQCKLATVNLAYVIA
jgi:hypothetical protein